MADISFRISSATVKAISFISVILKQEATEISPAEFPPEYANWFVKWAGDNGYEVFLTCDEEGEIVIVTFNKELETNDAYTIFGYCQAHVIEVECEGVVDDAMMSVSDDYASRPTPSEATRKTIRSTFKLVRNDDQES